MKTRLVTALSLAFLSIGRGADPAPLRFPDARIGVPPLSLRESIAERAGGADALPSGNAIPRFSVNPESQSPALAPRLVPRSPAETLRNNVQRNPRPRVSRSMGMPVIEPNDSVNCKITIVPPDPNVDFKLVIRNPTPDSQPADAR